MTSDIISLDPDIASATTINTVRLIGDSLEAAYPGWLWYVEVRGGIAHIQTMHADPKRGYRLHLGTDFYSASELKKMALRAGGELLERLNLPRRAADWQQINERPSDLHGFLRYQT
jgi:hypothetical protein